MILISKQKTIGVNPLEEYLAQTPLEKNDSNIENSEFENSQKKQRITIHIPITLIERAKNAVYWRPGLTLAGFAQEAFERQLEVVEAENGTAYPDRKEKQLRGGRPLK